MVSVYYHRLSRTCTARERSWSHSMLIPGHQLRLCMSRLLGIVGAVGVVAASIGAQAVPGEVDAGLRKWAEQSKAGLNPTVETPTEIEGEWLGPCFPVKTTFNGKVAQSANVGFVFRGNSFYR